MLASRWIQIVCVLLACGFVAAAGMVSPRLHEKREWYKAFGGKEATLPPQVVISNAALMTFRGLAINFLWERANQMQEQGKYFEANQISEWITTLQPRFAQVWVFRAWNMAYNISVATNTPQERWEWVRKGVELLRDSGIRQNPRSARLYRELQFFFYHKIAGMTDDMNWYYKRRLAQEWQEVLGNPAGETSKQVVDEFRPIPEAPDTLPALLQANPKVGTVLERLAPMNAAPDEAMLRRIGQVYMVTNSPNALVLGLDPALFPTDGDRAVYALLKETDPEIRQAFDALVAHLRKRVLIDRYNMNPAKMLEIMEKFGPVDWRHGSGQALYWAYMGVELDYSQRTKLNIDLLNTYRGVGHALQDLMYRGRLYYDPLNDTIDLLPDPRFTPAIDKALEMARDYMNTAKDYPHQAKTSFDVGYENFLVTATCFAYLYGDQEQAQAYYEKTRRLFKDKPNAQERVEQYKLRLEDFVVAVYPELLWNMQHARQYVDALLVQGFTHGLAKGRPEVFARFVEMARQAQADWNKQRLDAKPNADPVERMLMLPFERLLAISYIEYMKVARVDLITRARIWADTPPELRVRTYDYLADPIAKQCQEAGLDVKIVLPEPPGMEAYRATRPTDLYDMAESEGEAAREPVRVERR